jgi:hemerythrin superfamily protein
VNEAKLLHMKERDECRRRASFAGSVAISPTLHGRLTSADVLELGSSLQIVSRNIEMGVRLHEGTVIGSGSTNLAERRVMKATDLLKTQHRKVEVLFDRIDSEDVDSENSIRELTANLAAHMAIEEIIFYPAVKAMKENLILESFEEHDVARFAIRNLLATPPDAENFSARVNTLRELIEHHVAEEEEELFPDVEDAIDEDQLETMGKEMKLAFDKLVVQGFVELYGKSNAKPKVPTKGVFGKRKNSRSDARP